MQIDGSFLFMIYLRVRLFENQLGEVVQTVFPNHEVMTLVGIVDEGARNTVLVAEGLQLRTVVHQTVGTAANHPQQLVLLLHLLHIRNKLCGTLRVGS